MKKKRTNYSYFDNSEEGMYEFIYSHEPCSGYWFKSEDYVLNKITSKHLRHKNGNLLDIGCGDGRLSDKMYVYFENITAIDPDKKRINNAKKLIKPNLLKKTKLIADDFLHVNLPFNYYDCIICCHIIQHIPDDYLENWFKKIRQLLKPGGLLVLMTSITSANSDVFAITNEKMYWKEVDKSTFESSYNRHNLIGRQFSLKTLSKCLAEFKLQTKIYYHAMYKLNFFDSFVFRDKLLNFSPLGKFFGKRLSTDIVVVVSK